MYEAKILKLMQGKSNINIINTKFYLYIFINIIQMEVKSL